jgi:hypothetical protein
MTKEKTKKKRKALHRLSLKALAMNPKKKKIQSIILFSSLQTTTFQVLY